MGKEAEKEKKYFSVDNIYQGVIKHQVVFSRSFICINSFHPQTPSVVGFALIQWEFPGAPCNITFVI